MGHRHDDRSSRRGPLPEPSPGRGGEESGRAFDRNEDMGGARWSGASGRGGMSSGGAPQGREEPSYARPEGYGGYPAEGVGAYGGERRGHSHDEGVFLREQGFGHVPGQRWSGGYGGDRDRVLGQPAPPQRFAGGRGFTGSDFGPSYPASDMGMGAPHIDRGPHYGKGPKGYKRSSERTREEVCEAIAHQGHIDASDVEVKVEDGVVTLTGTVPHRHDKRGLEHLVERCRGVDYVHNELRLKREGRPQQQPAASPPAAPASRRDGRNGKAS